MERSAAFAGIDCIDEGAGPAVVLLHSSVSGNRQWRALAEALRARHRVLAPNLIGYGATAPWRGPGPLALADAARVVEAVTAGLDTFDLVGHSFGAAVALKAAAGALARVRRLVLIEPNPFRLLEAHGRQAALGEAVALRDHVKRHGGRGEWEAVARVFADYWGGDGSWAAMPARRREAFVAAMPPNFHEWDAVMGDAEATGDVARVAAATLVVSAADTRRPIGEIVEVLAALRPDWAFARLAEGGHMAPLSRPDLVNPLVAAFLAPTRA